MVTIRNSIFDQNAKIESSNGLFETVTFIELFKNEMGELFTSIPTICNFFELGNRGRDYERIKNILIYLQDIKLIHIENDTIDIRNNMIIKSLDTQDEFYRNYDSKDILKIINHIKNHGDKKYRVGLVYYSIIKDMPIYNNNYQPKFVSYESIMKDALMGNRNAVKSHLDFLKDNNMLIIKRKTFGFTKHLFNEFSKPKTLDIPKI